MLQGLKDVDLSHKLLLFPFCHFAVEDFLGDKELAISLSLDLRDDPEGTLPNLVLDLVFGLHFKFEYFLTVHS